VVLGSAKSDRPWWDNTINNRSRSLLGRAFLIASLMRVLYLVRSVQRLDFDLVYKLGFRSRHIRVNRPGVSCWLSQVLFTQCETMWKRSSDDERDCIPGNECSRGGKKKEEAQRSTLSVGNGGNLLLSQGLFLFAFLLGSVKNGVCQVLKLIFCSILSVIVLGGNPLGGTNPSRYLECFFVGRC
jgi:hypothetical protein